MIHPGTFTAAALLLVAATTTVTVRGEDTTVESPNQRPAAPQEPLFFGKDSATWLPKTESMLSGEDVEQIAQKLSSRSRNLDPFGVAVFPSEDAAPEEGKSSSRPTPKVTLNQALQTLKLNGVNLAQKAFLVGGRSVFEGDVIELAFREEVFQALVVDVGAQQIEFRDLEREETGMIPHSMFRRLELQRYEPVSPSLKKRMIPYGRSPRRQPSTR